jgi:hypothetical protein
MQQKQQQQIGFFIISPPICLFNKDANSCRQLLTMPGSIFECQRHFFPHQYAMCLRYYLGQDGVEVKSSGKKAIYRSTCR